jgi:hypothetical protein
MKRPLDKQRSLSPAVTLLWLGLTAWGTITMMSYSIRPGPAGSPPSRWPADSNLLRPPDHPALVMFAHPNCGRTKADIEELSRLVASCGKRVNVHVLFFKPAAESIDWVRTDLWRAASQIPGIVIAPDNDGREARAFGAATSGEVVLYDRSGRLRFRGGLTASSEHPNENSGRKAIEALVCGRPTPVTQTPVYGCSLFDHNLTARN